ncbi:MAG: hypothetical protein COU07_03735 [Candidatus Harrisonbacteria bacterium CG10_big_fil_rev_8_21_14_0_10_40_38]|uniref:Uncharacterized protein n=1 Tax=Candidatus Harrisonbacteria bacterium CG10_big_fil_rev_8_21_14_0_10_40_38 TaxID=1974583 RepID=A0A2H0URH0_9BACT|nr:MAG: hypothetical protein COU07_03735 [Candidatus Harrisonbacteria bacterium CG10_big_fil_rev_8_21_14_0_10_40_38]
MLPKRYKLPIQSFVSIRGKRNSSPHFILVVFPAKCSYPRFGVVIPKKYAQKAVQRNKIKRFFFDFIEENLKNIALGDYLLRVRSSIDVENLGIINSELSNIFFL